MLYARWPRRASARMGSFCAGRPCTMGPSFQRAGGRRGWRADRDSRISQGAIRSCGKVRRTPRQEEAAGRWSGHASGSRTGDGARRASVRHRRPSHPGRPAPLRWDGENRLTAVNKLSPATGDRKLEFDYDYMSRRIGRRKYTWFGGAGESKARRSEYWCAGDAHGAVGRPAA